MAVEPDGREHRGERSKKPGKSSHQAVAQQSILHHLEEREENDVEIGMGLVRRILHPGQGPHAANTKGISTLDSQEERTGRLVTPRYFPFRGTICLWRAKSRGSA